MASDFKSDIRPHKLQRIFISCDIEGISGVVHGDHTGPGQGEEYARARRLMTRQVSAAVSGAIQGGADVVLVKTAMVGGATSLSRNSIREPNSSPARRSP